MRKKLFSILALLLMAVTGAWAQNTYTVQFKNKANGKTVTSTVSLPHIFICNSQTNKGDLDLIIQELYELEGGSCSSSAESYSVTGSTNVTTGSTANSKYITISAPFSEVVTYTGEYYRPSTTLFNFTIEITILGNTISLKDGTVDADKWTISPNPAMEGATVTATYSGKKKVTSVKAVKKAAPTPADPNLLPGVFSVSATETVQFSKGNLRYVSGTWSFFENQYDYYDTYSETAWDKFGWSTSTTYGMSISQENSDYSGDFVDWGNVPGIGTGWRTLTKDEWVYLFGTDDSNKRTTTSGIYYAKAQVNGVNGVILLPDNWSSSYYELSSTNAADAAYTSNTITESDWTSKLEAHGAVFLPAAGRRYGSSVYDVGDYGYYWSSTAYVEGVAYYVAFDSYGLLADNFSSRSFGQSVRLAIDVAE